MGKTILSALGVGLTIGCACVAAGTKNHLVAFEFAALVALFAGCTVRLMAGKM